MGVAGVANLLLPERLLHRPFSYLPLLRVQQWGGGDLQVQQWGRVWGWRVCELSPAPPPPPSPTAAAAAEGGVFVWAVMGALTRYLISHFIPMNEGLGLESQCVQFGHPNAGGCQRSTGDPRLIIGKGYRHVGLGGYGRTDPLFNKLFYPNGLVTAILTWCQSGLRRVRVGDIGVPVVHSTSTTGAHTDQTDQRITYVEGRGVGVNSATPARPYPGGPAGTHGDGEEAALQRAEMVLLGRVSGWACPLKPEGGSNGARTGEWSPPSDSPPPLSLLPSLPAVPCLDHSGVSPSPNPPLPTSQQPQHHGTLHGCEPTGRRLWFASALATSGAGFESWAGSDFSLPHLARQSTTSVDGVSEREWAVRCSYCWHVKLGCLLPSVSSIYPLSLFASLSTFPLYLPAVPSLSSFPQFLPSVPSLSSFPQFLPSVPSLSSLPQFLPSVPSLNSLPQFPPSALPQFLPSVPSLSSFLPSVPSLSSFPQFPPSVPSLSSFPQFLPSVPSLSSLPQFPATSLSVFLSLFSSLCRLSLFSSLCILLVCRLSRLAKHFKNRQAPFEARRRAFGERMFAWRSFGDQGTINASERGRTRHQKNRSTSFQVPWWSQSIGKRPTELQILRRLELQILRRLELQILLRLELQNLLHAWSCRFSCVWSCRISCTPGAADSPARLELQILLRAWSCRFSCAPGAADSPARLELQILLRAWSCRFSCAPGAADSPALASVGGAGVECTGGAVRPLHGCTHVGAWSERTAASLTVATQGGRALPRVRSLAAGGRAAEAVCTAEVAGRWGAGGRGEGGGGLVPWGKSKSWGGAGRSRAWGTGEGGCHLQGRVAEAKGSGGKAGRGESAAGVASAWRSSLSAAASSIESCGLLAQHIRRQQEQQQKQQQLQEQQLQQWQQEQVMGQSSEKSILEVQLDELMSETHSNTTPTNSLSHATAPAPHLLSSAAIALLLNNALTPLPLPAAAPASQSSSMRGATVPAAQGRRP
ncbi:unnamed protein product [Closterium sp. NIES-54]